MGDREWNSVFEFGIYLAIAVWVTLVVLVIRHYLRKNRAGMRITLLYLLNSVVFLLAYGMFMGLALLVLGPKDADVLRQKADAYFLDLVRFSVLTLLVLALMNFLYLKFLVKLPVLRQMLFLLALDAIVLFAAAYVSVESYYQGLLPDTH